MKIHRIAVLLGAWLLFSCSLGRVPKNLKPEEQEFLSQVRYIISREERKAFLGLPASERPKFIEEFWQRRDSDPSTETNEYKTEYLKRIDEAKRLFTEGGTSGWLTDRGRIYILVGPPEQRETYPRGYSFYGVPLEIWHYGFYEIRFFDTRWNGNFELDPTSAQLLAEINVAQLGLRSQGKTESQHEADLKLDVKLVGERQQRVVISLPYSDIWFSSDGEKFKTTLEIAWEIYDAGNRKIGEGSKAFPLEVTADDLRKFKGHEFNLDFPLDLGPGEYQVAIVLKNLAAKTEVRKRIKLTI